MKKQGLIIAFVFAALFASKSGAFADAGTSAFGYDMDGRLRTAHYSNGNCAIYTFDANGNRLSASVIAQVSSPPKWGQSTWGTASWVAGNSNAVWGSGTLGCAVWTAP